MLCCFRYKIFKCNKKFIQNVGLTLSLILLKLVKIKKPPKALIKKD